MKTRSTRMIVFIAAAILGAGPAHTQDIAAGRGIAQVWCSNCHLADPQEQASARDAVPAFLSIARMKSTTEASLAAFLENPPHGGMPNLTLSRKEIQDVSAYILSLRQLP
jgi:mono/diheme cytochrome c family protein